MKSRRKPSTLAARVRARWHYLLGVAQRSRGNQYASRDAYEDAIGEFTQAVALDPALAAAHYARANIYWRELSDYERAVRDYSRALELNPRLANAYLNRGLSRVYGRLGTRDEAIADFERYLELGRNGYWRIEASNQIMRLKQGQA
jgi:tetratricopeptide (TPR) repeat protein